MNKKIKAVLLAALIVAVIAPIGWAYAAETEDDDSADTKTIREFKEEVREWLKHDTKDRKSLEQKVDELNTKYEVLFKAVIEEVRVNTGTRSLTENEILAAINYITYETVKDERIKIMREEAAGTRNVGFLGAIGIPTAEAACPATTEPNYKQVQIDIDGGTYFIYGFNGNNDLYDVDKDLNAGTCEMTYTLYFYDEDHPFADAFYDGLRQVMYGRTHDIESFTIKNNNQIKFYETWSSTNSYADCVFDFTCHKTTTKTYVPGQTVYVSNTWNHMMDTSDTNRSLQKVSVP